MARILVAYATKRNGTAEIAERIAEELRSRGHEVDSCAARRARLQTGYDAAVVGSCLYAGRWRREAVKLVAGLARTDIPVWLFHSGPLGDEEAVQPQPLPKTVERRRDRIDLRDATTFGGRLTDRPGGFIANAMARNGRAGDWRDLDGRVADWAHDIATAVE